VFSDEQMVKLLFVIWDLAT